MKAVTVHLQSPSGQAKTVVRYKLSFLDENHPVLSLGVNCEVRTHLVTMCPQELSNHLRTAQ